MAKKIGQMGGDEGVAALKALGLDVSGFIDQARLIVRYARCFALACVL